MKHDDETFSRLIPDMNHLKLLMFVTAAVVLFAANISGKFVGEYPLVDECELRASIDDRCATALERDIEACFVCVHAAVAEACPVALPPDCNQTKACFKKVDFSGCPTTS